MSGSFTRKNLWPTAAMTSEVTVPGGCYCIELVRGGQPGTRLGFTSRRDAQASIPFDAAGSSVPAAGLERFWIHWPDVLDSTAEQLELILWTTPALYARREGQEGKLPLAFVLFHGEIAVTVSQDLGPWDNIPYGLIVDGEQLRMPRGARLIGQFGFVGSNTADASVEIAAISGGTLRMVKGVRGVGVPSRPATQLCCDFDMAVPLGQFDIRLACDVAATPVSAVVYIASP